MSGDEDARPRIALTMGDPAGVGPEIVAAALSDEGVARAARCLVFGDVRVLERAKRLVKGAGPSFRSVESPSEARYAKGVVDVVHLSNADPALFEPGRVCPLCGRAAFEYVERAVGACLSGAADAVATAPINKESLRAAGLSYVGHTEMLAALGGALHPLTMFETRGLRIFFLSRHVSLREACELVTKERLFDALVACDAALRALGVSDGEIAVAGLNPHCGEHGLFGDEEGRAIEPAVLRARSLGLRVAGPIGADSVFHQAKTGRYAAVLSLYHDQGHIAAKTFDFERTVSLTLGLPFLRTSVDHGTAFDISWTGRASPISMIEAILVAARYAKAFRAA